MNEHVVEYQSSGHPEGMIAVLPAHAVNERLDWLDDGVTCPPHFPCSAIAEVTNERCAKREAVVMVRARAKYARVDSLPIEVHLCGGHFNRHRAGGPIRVVVTTGRSR